MKTILTTCALILMMMIAALLLGCSDETQAPRLAATVEVETTTTSTSTSLDSSTTTEAPDQSGPVLCLYKKECLWMPGGLQYRQNSKACTRSGGDPSGNSCNLPLLGCCDLQQDTACYTTDHSTECYQSGGIWQVSQ